jgi:predicted amidohydrolase
LCRGEAIVNEVNHTLEKEQILRSTDILNLLGNLYVLCAREFTGIYNHIQNNREGCLDFFTIYQAFQEEIRQICEEQGTFDVFKLEIKGILDKLPENCNGAQSFPVTAWALLKALDISMGEAPHHLSAMDSVMICKASPALGNHRFRLLFKPENLIWEMLQEADIMIRTGDNIGIRIEDHLKKLIFYREDLTRRIKINRLNKKVDIPLAQRETELAIAISPICCSFDYSFESFRSNGTVPYVFSGINNKEKIKPFIDRALNQCLDENVAIVVFPELTIDSNLRKYIADWLRLNNSEQRILMVIAGSFHFPVNGENGTDGKYVNSSVAFAYDGQELWKQEKMHPFKLTEQEIKKMFENSKNGRFKEMFNKDDTEGRERIEISDTLEVIESSIGRMATLICLDLIVKEKGLLVVNPGINMIFAPTMSRTLSRMVGAAREFGTNQQASVFCANSCWVISGGRLENVDNKNTGFIYTPKSRGFEKIDCNRKDCAKCRLHYIRVGNLKK